MITPEQCRAGRALLNWSQAKLAEATRLSKKTITDFEGGVRAYHESTSMAVEVTLHVSGVDFIAANGGGAGVRLRKAMPRLFRRDDVEGRGWVAFAFDYKGARHIGFVTHNALAGMALEKAAPPIVVFDTNRDRLLMAGADKVDRGQLDPEGRALLTHDDLPPVYFDGPDAG